MRVQCKKIAIDDIQETERYVSKETHTRRAAQKLTRLIVQTVSLLAENPYMGTPLNSKNDVDTDIRFLLVSKHLIFYRVREPACVEAARVIYGRQDYMAILF